MDYDPAVNDRQDSMNALAPKLATPSRRRASGVVALAVAWLAAVGCARASMSHLDAGTLAFAPVFPLEGHVSLVADAVYSPDGRTVVSADGGGKVMIWDAASGRRRYELTADGVPFSRLRYAKDGSFVVAIGRGFVGTIDVEHGVWSKTFELGLDVAHNAVAVSDDATLLALGSSDTYVRVVDLASGEARELGSHEWPIEDVKFVGNDRLVLAADAQTIRLWDVDHATETTRILDTTTGALPDVYWMSQLAFSEDGSNVLVASGDDALLVDLAAHEVRTRYKGHTDEVVRVAFAERQNEVVTASRDHRTTVWDLDTGKAKASDLAFDFGWVTTVALSPSADRIVMGANQIDMGGGVFRSALGVWSLSSGH
jgi:WD40 repeat protein